MRWHCPWMTCTQVVAWNARMHVCAPKHAYECIHIWRYMSGCRVRACMRRLYDASGSLMHLCHDTCLAMVCTPDLVFSGPFRLRRALVHCTWPCEPAGHWPCEPAGHCRKKGLADWPGKTGQVQCADYMYKIFDNDILQQNTINHDRV